MPVWNAWVSRPSGLIKSGVRHKRLIKLQNVSQEQISIINLNCYVIIVFITVSHSYSSLVKVTGSDKHFNTIVRN